MALQEEFEHQGSWLFRYRSWLPLIVLPPGTGLYARKELDPTLELFTSPFWDGAWLWFCLGVSLLGLTIRVFTIGYAPKNTSGRNTKAGQVAESINQSGIYSMVRHPLYLGNFFMWLGVALLAQNLYFIAIFALLYWIYYERIMFAEEQFLRGKFGDKYLQWANKTPAFIPTFKHYEKPTLPMSWKKVLRQEKNGFAAIFIIFATLDIVGELFKTQPHYNLELAGAAAVSLLIYLILKYLKKKTTLLNETGR